MWKSLKTPPERESSNPVSQESNQDDDFLAMFDTDAADDSGEASDTLCSRQILIKKYGKNTEALWGDLVTFRHTSKELVKTCAALTVSLAGSGYFDQTLHCSVLHAGQGQPLCLISPEEQVVQERFSDTNDLLKTLEQHGLHQYQLKERQESDTAHPVELNEPHGEHTLELLTNIAVLTLLEQTDQATLQQQISFQAVALTRTVSADKELATSLLHHVNKLFAGTSVNAESVDHAMMLLGQNRFLRWLSARAVLRLGQLCESQSVALMALRRASLLSALADGSEDHFLAGILSLLPILMGCDPAKLAVALEQLPANEAVPPANALGFKAAPEKLLGNLAAFADKIALVEALEKADWKNLDSIMDKLGLTEKKLGKALAEAVKWEGTL